MSGGGIEREREGAWEQGREGNFKGGSIFTNQPFTNRPLPLRLGAYAMAWTRCINHLVYNILFQTVKCNSACGMDLFKVAQMCYPA